MTTHVSFNARHQVMTNSTSLVKGIQQFCLIYLKIKVEFVLGKKKHRVYVDS